MPLAPSTSFNFVAALKLAVQKQQAVQLTYLAGGGVQRTLKGCILSVSENDEQCMVQREDESRPRQYWIRYLFTLIDENGIETSNEPALQKHREVLEQRKQRENNGQRLLADSNFVPPRTYVTSALAGKLNGTINGEKRDFYFFQTKDSTARGAIIYARDEINAVRCMQLLDTDHSVWDFFAVYLQAHFIWPAWLTLQKEAQAKATKARDGMPKLPPDADWDQRTKREALYASCGLSEENYGATAKITSLEGEPIDFISLFDMADRVPTNLLNLYLMIAWNSNQFFDDIERVDDSTLKQFIRYGFVAELPDPSTEEALERLPIAKLRELVAFAGTGFKARSGDALRAHLRSCMTPALALEAMRRLKRPKYQLLPPPNWTWEQFQFLRSDYQDMIRDLSQWLFNGRVSPEASKRFTTLV